MINWKLRHPTGAFFDVYDGEIFCIIDVSSIVADQILVWLWETTSALCFVAVAGPNCLERMKYMYVNEVYIFADYLIADCLIYIFDDCFICTNVILLLIFCFSFFILGEKRYSRDRRLHWGPHTLCLSSCSLGSVSRTLTLLTSQPHSLRCVDGLATRACQALFFNQASDHNDLKNLF